MANSSTRYVWRNVDLDSILGFEFSPYTFDLDGFDREDVCVVSFWDPDPIVWENFNELVGE